MCVSLFGKKQQLYHLHEMCLWMQIYLLGEKLLAHGIRWNHRLVLFYKGLFIFNWVNQDKGVKSIPATSQCLKISVRCRYSDLSVAGWRSENVSFLPWYRWKWRHTTGSVVLLLDQHLWWDSRMRRTTEVFAGHSTSFVLRNHAAVYKCRARYPSSAKSFAEFMQVKAWLRVTQVNAVAPVKCPQATNA